MKRPILLGVAAIGLLGSILHAQVPQIINYQGRILVGTDNFDGTGQFKFALVNANGTITYWSNDGSSTTGNEPNAAVSLNVNKGLYSILLGDTSITNMTVSIPVSVFNNSDVRLRVWFDDGTNGSQLLSPDQRIASAGYALIASTVPDGSITGTKIAPTTITSINIADGAIGSTQLASSLSISGNFTLSDPTKSLLIGAASRPADDVAGKLEIFQDTGDLLPAISVVGHYRNGSSGERYGVMISANRITTNGSFNLTGGRPPAGVTPVPYMMTIFADVPTSIFHYNPFNEGQGGKILLGYGAHNVNPVVDWGSQGKLQIDNVYGSSYNDAQIVLKNTGSSTHPDIGMAIREVNGIGFLGTYTVSTGAKTNELQIGSGLVTVHGVETIQAKADNTTLLKMVRFQNGSPTGNFIDARNNGEGQSLYRVDIKGAVTSGNFSATGNGSIIQTIGSQDYQLDLKTGTDQRGCGIRLLQSGSTVKNWFVGSNAVTRDTFEIIPATAAGGTTFSTPAMKLTPSGNLTVTGNLSVGGTKNFKIDHPLDPANKYLVHAAIESSEVLNLYSGNAVLDANGQATIRLPDWFTALNQDFRYHLTAIGGPAPNLHVDQEISDNQFKIGGGQPGSKVSWQVTACRQDAYMQAHPFEVEQAKPQAERGIYLYPESFGQPRVGDARAPARSPNEQLLLAKGEEQ